MATLLAENPQANGDQPTAPVPSAGQESEPPAGPPAATATGPVCEKCAAPLAPGQDWCLQCGSGAPGSVGGGGLGSLATIVAVTVVLVLGAGAAAYAALSIKQRRAPLVTTTVAQATPPPAATPTTPGLATPGTTVPGLTKPPKIPLQATTPTATTTTPTTTTTTTTPTTTTNSKEKGTTGGAGSEPKVEPLLLDTNAASTYNPYGYPATNFGDPSLTIDGDTSTGWSAQVIPASAPNLAEGVLIDLHTAQKIGSLKLVTTTPGMTVQVFGANGHTVPASITDPAWKTLSRSIVVKKRHAHLGLRDKKKSFRFIALWISRAPASAVGTAEAPGRVSVNELELFPASTG